MHIALVLVCITRVGQVVIKMYIQAVRDHAIKLRLFVCFRQINSECGECPGNFEEW